MPLRDIRTTPSQLYAEERYRTGAFYCDICQDRWPMSHQRQMLSEEGGVLRVGKLCCWERVGTLDRTLLRQAATKKVAALSAREFRPPRAPDGETYAGIYPYAADSYITAINPQDFNLSISSLPIVLVAGGAHVTFSLYGIGFTSADVIAYGSTGIVNNSAASLVSATQWTLDVKANGGTAKGYYTLTFNGTPWRNVLEVSQ